MTWWYAVVEARHELQNPTSADKIRLLGERLDLGSSSRVLDIGAGKGGPARILVDAFGCRVTCVERSTEFASVARERATANIDVVEADGRTFEFESGAYDAALCLGASFVYGGPVQTLEALKPAAPLVALGEPYWRRWPLPDAFEADEDEKEWKPLLDTVELVESTGVQVVSIIDASLADWDRYETLHWLALDEWLAANPEAPEAEEFRARGQTLKERYLRWRRDLLGWAIFVCRT
jgi:SAM-dependent methyltransferase